MSPYMLLQRRRFREMLSTLFARKWTMTGVSLQVPHNFLFTREAVLAGSRAPVPEAIIRSFPTSDMLIRQMLCEGGA